MKLDATPGDLEQPDYQNDSEEENDQLDQLGLHLALKRTEAIRGRDQTAIEDEWQGDEEFYEGVDDANRSEGGAWRSKPAGRAAVPSATNVTGSTAFFNITRPYVDAAAARVGDMLLPTDDRGWAIRPTPVPELGNIAEGKIPPKLMQQIIKGTADEIRAAAWMGVAYSEEAEAELINKNIDDVTADAEKVVKEAKDKAAKAEKRIDDWHVECQYQAQMRSVIEDSARIGTGVMKGPMPIRQRVVAYVNGSIVIQDQLQPASFQVDPWNCFPDPACGESIHNGSYHFERADLSRKKLRQLRDQPGYIEAQLARCLREGPFRAVKEIGEDGSKSNRLGLQEPKEKSDNLFEIWYGYVELTRIELEAAGCDCSKFIASEKKKRAARLKDEGLEPPKDQDDDELEDPFLAIPAQVEMINNHVVKAVLNPMDTGEFPYDYMPWSKRAGMPWGRGVARQIRVPQRMVNGGARNMMDNAGIAGGPMIIIHRGLVEPADDKWTIAPRKIWFVGEDADFDDVGKAFQFVTVPMVQEQLEAIINLGLKFAEDVTGMPAMLQGQMGSAPDTVGGMKILNDNAGAPLRRLARMFDDKVTEPHVRRYYNYLLQYGPAEDEKGDLLVDARGSSALVERDLNQQSIREMGELVSDPRFGLDPKKWMGELLKSQRLDLKKFEFDDDEWKQVVEQMSQPPQDPAQMVAEIRAAVEEMKIQATAAENQKDRDMEVAMQATKHQHQLNEDDKQIAMKAIDQALKETEIGSKERVDLERIKADLARDSMKIEAQVAMNDQTIAPETAEPAGRAPDGQGYAK